MENTNQSAELSAADQSQGEPRRGRGSCEERPRFLGAPWRRGCRNAGWARLAPGAPSRVPRKGPSWAAAAPGPPGNPPRKRTKGSLRGGAGLDGPDARAGAGTHRGAAECGVIVLLENISDGEPAERGAVETEPRKGMSASRRELPGLFLSNPCTTPPTRHLGRKGGMSNGKA